MKKSILLTVLCLASYLLNAQITTNEQPYSLKMRAIPLVESTVKFLPVPDRSKIDAEDYENDKAPGPVRFAYAVKAGYEMQNSGTWSEMGDGSKIWRLKVVLPGALSTNAIYEKFWLPEGGKFFVYSEETGQSIGAITSEYIGGSKDEPIEFATAIIYGESVVFEYYHPPATNDLPEIVISRVDYGYRYVDNPYRMNTRFFGSSNNCNININCPEGADWQNEKHAVARVEIPTPDGTSWCSCALVNNTTYDYAPYVLTADHCLAGLDAITNNNAGLWVFYWEYEHPGCENRTEPSHRTTVGATLKANHPDSDFALLLLTQNPLNRRDVLPYYLGWDKTGNSGTSGVRIHHPVGDVKKISTFNQIKNNPKKIDWTRNEVVISTTPPNTHWDATFYNGLIEGGSSGSPLLNNSRRVIGQLHGGPIATCNTNYVKRYGKFDVSWTGNGSSDNRRRLQPWLDPPGPVLRH